MAENTLPCVLCNDATNDEVQLGEKQTYQDTTAHMYCLFLTSNLMQTGEDHEGIMGFMPKAIKAEVSRTKKLFCFYCREKGATIGCSVKTCRRSFHLPCALKGECRFEFTESFSTYCDLHHNIKKPKKPHKSTDLCTVCYDEMGPYHPIQSIPLPCCNKNSWCHKLCLQKYAQTSGYFLKCPLCNDSENFRDWISKRGVFIPDRDARWEVGESGTNEFYAFERHLERPSECVAKVCKCPKGRKHQKDSETCKYSFIYCDYCGSHAIHLGCFKGKDFFCDECTQVINRCKTSTTKTVDGPTDQGTRRTAQTQSGQSTNRTTRYTATDKALMAKFDIRPFHILLSRMTPKDFGYQLEPIDSENESGPSSSGSNEFRTSTAESTTKLPTITDGKNKDVVTESENDSEDELVRFKRNRPMCINIMSDSSDSVDIFSKVDINENSMASNIISNVTSTSCLPQRPISISDEDEIRPVGARKLCFIESSDDQANEKENEKPFKNVAIVRPFPKVEYSTDTNIKPMKVQARRSQIISSDDDISRPLTSQLNLSFNMVKQKNSKMQAVEVPKICNVESTEKSTPLKRNRRTLSSYFRIDSSSNDESLEPKPKRRLPKRLKHRSPQIHDRPANQSSIMDYFKKEASEGY